MDWNKFLSTKFVATVGCGIATTALCYLGKIDGNIYATVIISTVGAFIAGDVTQKVKEAAINAQP